MEAKVIIVEGKTDKERLKQLIDEPVEIICTFGTLSDQKLEELVGRTEGTEVFILVDADNSGNKIRKQLKNELPNAKHLYTRKMYREVATTPMAYLAKILANAHFTVDEDYLIEGEDM